MDFGSCPDTIFLADPCFLPRFVGLLLTPNTVYLIQSGTMFDRSVIYSGHLLNLAVKNKSQNNSCGKPACFALLWKQENNQNLNSFWLAAPTYIDFPFACTCKSQVCDTFLFFLLSAGHLLSPSFLSVHFADVSYFNSFPLSLFGVFLFLAFIIHRYVPNRWTWTRRIDATPPQKNLSCVEDLLEWMTTIEADLEMDQGSKTMKMKITSSDSCPSSLLVSKSPWIQKTLGSSPLTLSSSISI